MSMSEKVKAIGALAQRMHAAEQKAAPLLGEKPSTGITVVGKGGLLDRFGKPINSTAEAPKLITDHRLIGAVSRLLTNR